MNMNEYQQQAAKTAIYPADQGLTYTVLGLASEAGELAGKLKKIIRDQGGERDYGQDYELAAELGDCLWYVALIARELGFDLSSIAAANLDKLADRANRGKLSGSGDNR